MDIFSICGKAKSKLSNQAIVLLQSHIAYVFMQEIGDRNNASCANSQSYKYMLLL